MDCFGTYSDTCPNLNVTRVQSATQWTASVHTLTHVRTLTRQARGRPIVVAHTGTIDSCWKQCKKMIPSSLSSRHPMLLTYCKAWQWRFVHRNDNVAQTTAKTLQKQMWWNKPARCPRFHWDLQKIVVFLQREIRFLFLHLWKFRTVLGGLDKMKCTCRCGKTVIFVDHNSSELRFQ